VLESLFKETSQTMKDSYSLLDTDLVENPTPRVPVCLVLDTSYSMKGAPILALNNGIRHFFEAIRENDYARFSVEITIVEFGGKATKILDFQSVDKSRIPTLIASGGTPMGTAVGMATDLLESRKKEYQAAGVDYHQPWLVLMTDGQPTDEIEEVASKVKRMVKGRRLTIFPIGIGKDADLDTLEKFSPTQEPVLLQGLKFHEFFGWLSESVSVVSSNLPGEHFSLDKTTQKDWTID